MNPASFVNLLDPYHLHSDIDFETFTLLTFDERIRECVIAKIFCFGVEDDFAVQSKGNVDRVTNVHCFVVRSYV